MKKLFIIIVMLLSFLSTEAIAQDYKIMYDSSYSDEDNVWKYESTVFCISEDLSSLIVEYFPSKKQIKLERISRLNKGATNSGYKYYGANYYNSASKETVLVQFFEDQEFGIRITKKAGPSIQYAGTVWIKN